MDTNKLKPYERILGVERPLLMLPLNVIVMGRINGRVPEKDIRSAIINVCAKHPLLSVRVVNDSEGNTKFTSSDVPHPEVRSIPRQGMDHWVTVAEEHYRDAFDLEKGPLARFHILHDDQGFELIICAHHVICDGMSMCFAIRDILKAITSPSSMDYSRIVPPEITMETANDPPKMNGIIKLFFSFINKKWNKKQTHFSLGRFQDLNQVYWKANHRMKIKAWELETELTRSLVSRCRAEKVTVNTALWTAFLQAQSHVQGNKERFRNQAGLAVSVRDKLKIDVGEAFGFYASSLSLPLRIKDDLSFWDQSRKLQNSINNARKKKNPLSMLISSLIEPGLIDSLYLAKYKLFESKLSKRFLGKMAWDKLNYGYSITNVGKVKIESDFGDLKLDSIYGPVVYSDVNEKTVGVTTVDDKLTFVMTYNMDIVGEEQANEIRSNTNQRLSEALR